MLISSGLQIMWIFNKNLTPKLSKVISGIVKIFFRRKIPILLEFETSSIPDKLVEAMVFVDSSRIKTRRIINKMTKESNLLSYFEEVQGIRPNRRYYLYIIYISHLC